MDDSTSALDMETEHATEGDGPQEGFTCFIIAHRISAVKTPTILYFEDGRIER